MPGGRPSKLTDERAERILDALRAGNYLETAARYAGVSYDTLNEWRKRFPEFSEAVEKARADAEARNVAVLQQAARTKWQAAAWWLERSFPGRWGRRDEVNVSGNVGVTLSELVARAKEDKGGA